MGVIETVEKADAQTLALYDAFIDVRSPAEFEDDHIPGAVNLPVLSNEERAEVGTVYKQESRFKARRLGAAYAAKNVAAHLGAYFADKPPNFRPLVYCWRGGMRSGAMATIVSQVGWRTGLLKGGYKTWRRAVVAGLHDSEAPLDLVLLDGQTGTAKSDILRAAAGTGVQTLDLEALANHRGSVFGSMREGAQPGQKMFESLLWRDLSNLNPTKPVLVEAESNRIGRRTIPKRLWLAMLEARRIEVRAPIEARSEYLLQAYADMISDLGAIETAVEKLKAFHSKALLEEWREMVAARNWPALAESLMNEHYDPLYRRSRKRLKSKPLAEINLDALHEDAIEAAAQKIKSLL